MSKKVILTGLRTNAGYHLGNYLGAILPMVRLQKEHLGEYQVNMFAPDLHSFTTEIDYSSLYRQTMDNLKVFVAAGMPIDHPDFYMYRQSFIPAHSELTVILNNFTYFNELRRMTQFKEKINTYITIESGKRLTTESGEPYITPDSGFVGKNIVVGLFDYPVLMASDILLYGATYVPVGEDQRQHLELTRDLGIRMNNKFGSSSQYQKTGKKQLEFSHRLEGARIRSLRNPEKKMSKSVDDPSGTIQLTDTPEEARKKIMKAETDTVGAINWDWENQAGITNLLQIYEQLSDKNHDEVLAEWTGKDRYGDLKTAVADQVAQFLETFQSNLAAVNEQELLAKLEASEKAMNEVANATC